MKTTIVFSFIIVILLLGCEKEVPDEKSMYRISGLEYQGDTVANFIYNNNKLVTVENIPLNRTYRFLYDTNDRIEKIKRSRVEYAFTYYRNEEITIEVTDPNWATSYHQIHLNEEGKPIHYQNNGGSIGWDSEWRSHIDYNWEGDNLASIDYGSDPIYFYTSYSNPFYEIVNNHLWYFIYRFFEFRDLGYFVLPSKDFVSTITYWAMNEQVTREYLIVFDTDRNLVTAATYQNRYTMNFIYEIVDNN